MLAVGAAPLRAEAPPAAVTDAVAAAARWEATAKGLPSVAIALVDRADPAWILAVGKADAAGHRPATADQIFRAGSVSKLLTDVAVMRLVEMGKLDLDRPVTAYLPNFHPQNPFGGEITLRELMTHRSGLVRESPRGHYFDDHAVSQADTVASLNATTLIAPPGSTTHYSNGALAVVGEVVAHAAGMPYEAALQRLVLDPVGMTSSSLSLAAASKPPAYAEMASFDGPRRPAPVFDLGTPAAGNLYTTAGDLARFAQVMLNHGEAAGGRLLRPDTVEAMWHVQASPSPGARAFGLGFIVGTLGGARMVGHSGAVYGFSTELRLLPDDGIGVVVFSTVDAGVSAGRLARYALTAWQEARSGAPVTPYPESAAVTGDEARALSGGYARGSASVTARLYQGGLVIDGPEIAGAVRKRGDHYVIDDAQTYDEAIAFAPDAAWLDLDGKRFVRRIAAPAAPPPPDVAFAGLIGEYGWPYNILRIYERDGAPFARIEWTDYRPLRPAGRDAYTFPADRGLYAGEMLRFERAADGTATAALLNGIRFPRHDFGAEAQAEVRAAVAGDLPHVRAAALAATPPAEPSKPRTTDLVAPAALDGTIRLDIRYAGTNNFAGVPFYERAEAYLQRPAAAALARVSATLRRQGYGLLIHDAYRPWFVTKMFWDVTPPQFHQFVADPASGSRHNRGAAVDLTLYSLADGQVIVSTGRYDEFSDRSYSNYVGGSDRQRWIRDLLRTAMEDEGFTVYPEEWWHFDFDGWRDYPIINVPFDRLAAR